MAAGKWKVYATAKDAIATGAMDLDSDTFKINLYSSASNANSLDSATISVKSDITNQLSTANGYTQDNKSVTLSVSEASGTITVDETSNPVWTASGGSITARYAVIWSSTASIPLCVCLLDTTPADVTATSGNTLTITENASGLFTMSGATTD